MKNKKIDLISLSFNILLIAALIGGVILVGQNQNTQRGAYFSGSSLSILPTSMTANTGDVVPVQLWVQTNDNAKVSAVDANVCYGTGLTLNASDLATLIDLNQDAFKSIEYVKNDTTTNCLRLVVVSSGISPDNLKSGLVKVAAIRFTAASATTGTIAISSGAKVSGYNPTAGATDTAMSISAMTSGSYTIGQGTTTGTGPYLKFSMSFLGVKATDSACADGSKMPLVITVRAADGTTKAYSGILPTKTSGVTTDGLAIYNVGLPLTGFGYTNNIAIFVKGPKHLQVKYGVNGQQGFYNKAGGELSGLTIDPNTTQGFSFEKYPLLAGDVTGPTAGVQDGMVDGLDFAYIKNAANGRATVSSGGYMLGDINGNCAMESQDLSLMMISLNSKQGQLY